MATHLLSHVKTEEYILLVGTRTSKTYHIGDSTNYTPVAKATATTFLESIRLTFTFDHVTIRVYI